MALPDRVTLIGVGGVGQCLLACLPRMMAGLSLAKVTILDKEDRTKVPIVAASIKGGARFLQVELTRDNLEVTLDSAVGTAQCRGAVIDLTVGVGCTDIVAWCAKNGVLYTNTALELWDSSEEADWLDAYNSQCRTHGNAHLLEQRTLSVRQRRLRNMFPTGKVKVEVNSDTCVAQVKPDPSFMAVIDHGMNPGLVSHFVKAGLERIAREVLEQTLFSAAENRCCGVRKKLETALEIGDHAAMACLMDMRTVHISECDTQLATQKAARKPDEFLCTWSAAGFHEEGLDPVQLGWGTHERTQPPGTVLPTSGDHTQIFVAQRGIDCRMKSYVPTVGPIQGCNVPHSEGFTIASYLSVTDPDTKEVKYRPTVHYVYRPPDCSIESWEEVMSTADHTLHPKTRVLKGHEIESGYDAVGTLLLFPRSPATTITHNIQAGIDLDTDQPVAMWAGTILDIQQTRAALGSDPAPTTVQVVASIIAALQWMVKTAKEAAKSSVPMEERKQLFWPESLPSDEILRAAGPWLGTVLYEWVQWDDAPRGLQYVDMIAPYPCVYSPIAASMVDKSSSKPTKKTTTAMPKVRLERRHSSDRFNVKKGTRGSWRASPLLQLKVS